MRRVLPILVFVALVPAWEGAPRSPGTARLARPSAIGGHAGGGAWSARVEHELAAREYEASRNARGLQAPNRAHGLRTYFEPDGIRLVDRTDAGQPVLVAIRMLAAGRAGRMAPVPDGVVEHEGARVEIRRPGLTEWYENSAAGLEQGFTLDAPPPGRGSVHVDLAVAGAVVARTAAGLSFISAAGRSVQYEKLAVFDAKGATLVARLEANDGGFRIVVDDDGAVYPITIDPLLTSTADTHLGAFQANSQFGRHVASAGDVNGDGYADVIVGAEMYDAGEFDEGAAFLYLGSATGIPSNGPAATTLQSNQAQAFFGRVAGAGDVNGDGYADVIVGSHAYDLGQAEEGASFVFLGGPSGIANGSPATAAATLQANSVGATFGVSQASAGDVNGDGYADVIVGAADYEGRGIACVFLGSASGIASGNPLTAATLLQSSQALGSFGASVACAGDVNGDGYSDVIVGANRYHSPEDREGAAFVFLGSASGIASGNQTSAAAVLQSNQTLAFLGSCVAGAGDVNGDGYSDVVVGGSGYVAGGIGGGAAFVFLGSASGIASGTPATAAATIQSNQSQAAMGGGESLAAADLNGDGYSDLIVASAQYDAGQTDEGAVFVFVGGPSGVPSGNPATASFTLQSNQASAFLGIGVGAGDVNGDGYADVIAGAHRFDGVAVDEGAAFVYLGGAKGVLVNGSPAIAAATIQSDQGAGGAGNDAPYLGYGVAGAGDVNGDGYADVIVGAPYYDAGQTDEGAAFVFLGGPAGIPSGNPASAATFLQSDQAQARLGVWVAGAGDVDGDGYSDVIVGSPQYDSGQLDEGAAFLFRGGPSGIAGGSPATAAATFQSNQAGAGMGTCVAGAGDVNGDGFADVIVGIEAYGGSDDGAALVFHGSAAGISSGNPLTAATILVGSQPSAHLGQSVASAGDVNGDGYGDVVVGATYFDAGSTDEGAVFLFLGGPSGIASGGPGTAATTLEGNEGTASFGCSVSAAGDVNGDGYGDVVVGAERYGPVDGGAAFVFHGSAAGIANGGPATAASTFLGVEAQAYMGLGVSGAGDVNGDGYADVILGVPGYGDGGIALVYHGSATGLVANSAAAVLEADQAGAGMGAAVAAAGDVNGDGYADVIVAALGQDLGQVDEGAAFLFHGGGQQPVRRTLPRQIRGDGSGFPVQAWGSSNGPDFQVALTGFLPGGRGRVKLEVEFCPPGQPFGSAACTRATSSSWTDVGVSPSGVPLTHDLLPASNGLYHWRARTLRASMGVTQPGITAPPHPEHGPWRRLQGQAVEADVRTTPGALAVGRPRVRSGLAIEGLVNPARATMSFVAVLPRAEPARVELFDVTGRRRFARDLSQSSPGRHPVSWSGPRGLEPGVYRLRLSQGEHATTAGVVVVH